MFHRILSVFAILLMSFTAFAPAVRTQVCSPLPTGLVAWYKGEGNTNDSSSNGFHGVLSSGGFAAGRVGQAFSFTTQDQSAVIPNNAALFPLNALTIEGWINPLPYSGCVGGSYRTFHTVQTTITGYLPLINCDTGKLIGAIFDSAETPEAVTSNATVPTDTFTHFAMTWDGSNLRVYLNGVLDNTAPTTMPAIGTNPHDLRISNAQALGFRGLIDEISLYNRALSGAEVAAIFNAGTAGKCLAPTAASASISGRATTSDGRGLSKVMLVLSDQSGGLQIALTNPFGYYKFESVQTGTTVILTAQAKGREFVDPTRVITVLDSLSDVDFVALP